jgi:hypothetical protein
VILIVKPANVLFQNTVVENLSNLVSDLVAKISKHETLDCLCKECNDGHAYQQESKEGDVVLQYFFG